MIKAAIFDFNGVVITNNDLVAFRAAARARGVWFPLFLLRYFANNLAHQTGRLDSFSFWSRVLANGRAPLSREEFERLLVLPYRANKVYYGVLDLVAWLKRKGVKCILLTNTSDYQVTVNQALNRYRGFDVVILSHEIGSIKPFPGAFKAALKAANASAWESIFVDDSWYNLGAAKILGFHALAFQSPEQLADAVKKLI